MRTGNIQQLTSPHPLVSLGTTSAPQPLQWVWALFLHSLLGNLARREECIEGAGVTLTVSGRCSPQRVQTLLCSGSSVRTDCSNAQSCLPGALQNLGHFIWATSMEGFELMPSCLPHLRPWGFAVCRVRTVASTAHGSPSAVLGAWGWNWTMQAGTAAFSHAQHAPAPGGFQCSEWQGQIQLGWRKLSVKFPQTGCMGEGQSLNSL